MKLQQDENSLRELNQTKERTIQDLSQQLQNLQNSHKTQQSHLE